MREIILEITTFKNKKKTDFNITGSIAGCTAEKTINDTYEITIPAQMYAFTCDLKFYMPNFYIEDGHSVIVLPAGFERCKISALIP